jgi:exodeoxyribonuclease-5
MKLSTEQKHALSAVRRWLKNPGRKQVFRLFGYAGTGKTTIAKELVAGIDGVLFATFTGKAALVLASKGCEPAVTIHSLIYQPKEKSEETLKQLEAALERQEEMPLERRDEARIKELTWMISVEKKNLRSPSFSLNSDSPLKEARLLVIDEVSMVDANMARDLMSFDVPILCLGDPGQLPPVKGTGYFVQDEPDVLLTTIHRQAEGNPIIDLATLARSGTDLPLGDHGDSAVVLRGATSPAELAEFDQVLVGTHKMRNRANSAIRKVLGHAVSGLPQPGEKLICLRNDKETGILNGSQWQVHGCRVVDEDTVWLTISEWGQDRTPFDVTAWRHYFEGRDDDLDPWAIRDNQCFDFGYAITVHKSQGSQWGRVCVIDESPIFRSAAKNHLYTAITRAAESVRVIQS